MDEYRVDLPNESSVGLGCQVNYGYMVDTWQCVKTNSTPVVHIKIAGIYGCSSH